MPTPISLLVDDSCPLVHVYLCHRVDVHGGSPNTAYGKPMPEVIPNDFLDRFCDIVNRWGMAGKFSIVPAPGGKGDIVSGIDGFDLGVTRAWIDTMQGRLSGRFDFCPEGITHNLAVDLETGGYYPDSETAWSQKQTRATLTPYLTRELEYLRDAGINATGFTSPWVFGIEVEEEYIEAMVQAQKTINDRDFSWYFLHMVSDEPASRPWIARQECPTTLVSIPTTVDDVWWETIDSPRVDREFVSAIADRVITTDGREGGLRRVLDAGGWPVLLSHWQSFFSNGLETGLAALDEVGRRIADTLADEVTWMTCMEMARKTVADASPDDHGAMPG
jgi:hypothetical protein